MELPVHRAIFIDRDGVICRNRDDHVKSWEEFIFLPGALEALARLAPLPWRIVIVTNQAVINRGIVSRETVEQIHDRMLRAIGKSGGRVDRVMFCPHRPDERCPCRKPQPGLLLKAARELELDFSRSYFIGDAATDMQAARAVGCRPYLVLTGRGREQLIRCWINAELGFRVVPDLGAAVDDILRHEGATERRLASVQNQLRTFQLVK